MSKMLMKVQVGPVQEFIAQARSTRDMWAGSYLLSRMTARAMEVFDKEECEFIFPTLEEQPLYEMVTGKQVECDTGLIPTLPNVFMMLVPEEKTKEFAVRAKAAVAGELDWIAKACWTWVCSQGEHIPSEWEARWKDQLQCFPIFAWHAIPYNESKYWSDQVEELGQQMAARRNTREFKQWGFSPDEKGAMKSDPTLISSSKDILSGKEEIIGDDNFWKKIKKTNEINNAGPFGAVNLVKRLFPYCCFPNRKDYWNHLSMSSTRDMAGANKESWSSAKDGNGEFKPKNPYFAVIALDGDRMGAELKKITTKENHTKFSRKLACFSEQNVKGIVADYKGQLVYAGGDDVLTLCPADRALELAEKLRSKFLEVMGDYIDKDEDEKLDASCGIAVGHYQFPLQRIVDEARKAESRAKNQRGRAAFEMTLLKRSGEIIHWGAKWDSPALDVYRDFTTKVEDGTFSGRFAYALAELLQPYRLGEDTDVDMKPIIEKEFLHVQERQAQKKDAQVDGALDYLGGLVGSQLDDFPNLFLASAFMNRQRGEN